MDIKVSTVNIASEGEFSDKFWNV